MDDKENNVLNSLYNEDGTVKAPYADPNDSGKFATSVSTETVGVGQDDINSFLGGGTEAADGVQYKWDKQSAERAELNYKKNLLDTKANYLTNRQEIESQGQAAQQQTDMQKYSQNQSIDKVGWTGGYVLDTERQMNYLKASIQAQMYGQMELQRYGYDTSLAAARLAYDTDKYDLALKYYEQAIQNAVTESSQTGLYIAPEVREHANNYKIAADILNDPNATEEEKENAARVVTNVTNWYKDYGISPAGVKTMAKLAADAEIALSNQAQMKSMYEMYAIDTQNNYSIDIDSFGKVGADGKIITSKDENGVLTPEIINFNNMNANDLLAYAATHDVAKQQVYGYFENKVEQDINNYLETVKKVEGESTTYDVQADTLKQYLIDRGLKDITAIYTAAKNSEGYKTLLNDWNFETKAGTTPVYITINESGDIEVNINLKDDSAIVQTDTGEGTVDATTGNIVTDDWYYDSTGINKVAYNYTDINDLYIKLNDNGVQTGQKIVIDMNQDKSEWGDYIDQTHFDADTSKGKAGPYIEQIQADAKAGKIKVGQYVQLNYGSITAFGSANYTYVYIGNGQFAKCIIEPKDDAHRDRLADKFYVPDGYHLNKPTYDDYSDKFTVYKD
jgi:hypothetical protein